MNTIIKNNVHQYLGLTDLILHNFYLCETKDTSYHRGEGKNVIIFIGGNIGDINRVHYFYENEKVITHSDINHLLNNFRIKENVTEKCKLICEL